MEPVQLGGLVFEGMEPVEPRFFVHFFFLLFLLAGTFSRTPKQEALDGGGALDHSESLKAFDDEVAQELVHHRSLGGRHWSPQGIFDLGLLCVRDELGMMLLEMTLEGAVSGVGAVRLFRRAILADSRAIFPLGEVIPDVAA